LPSLRQLRYLLALAEHLNFTRAAEASFVSQSTLSTGLKELEGTLGVQLVERDKQSVALTAVGKDVVTRARQVLAAAEDLSDFASDASRPMQGRLRLGVIPTIAPPDRPKRRSTPCHPEIAGCSTKTNWLSAGASAPKHFSAGAAKVVVPST